MTARRIPVVQQAVASLLVAALGGYPVRALAGQGVPVQSVPPPPAYAPQQAAPQAQQPAPVQQYAPPPQQPAPQGYPQQPAPVQQYAPPPQQAAPQGYAPQPAPVQQYAPPPQQAAPQGYAQQPAPAQAAPPAYAPPPPAYAPPAAAGAVAAPGAPAAAPAAQGYAAPQAAPPPPAYAPPPPAYAPPAAQPQAPAPQGYAQQPAPASGAVPAAAGAAAGAAAAGTQMQAPAVQEVPSAAPRLPPGAVPVPQTTAPAPAPRTGEADLGSAPPPPPPPGYAPPAPGAQKSTQVDDRLIRLEWRPARVEGTHGYGPMVQVPVMGPEKRPLQGRSLYTALGRNDLAEEYERRAAAKRIMSVSSTLLLISGVAVGISAFAIHGCAPGDMKCSDDRDAQLRERLYWSGGLVLGGAALGIASSAYSTHPVSRDELVGLIREHNAKLRSQPSVQLGAMAVPGGGGLSLAGNF